MTEGFSWRSRGRCHVFGDNVPHDGGIIAFRFVMERQTDPEKLIPHLFAEIRPGLVERIQPGDFIVGGQNFSGGKAHVQGLIAMQAFGLRVLCESMRFLTLRAAASLALPVMHRCAGIRDLVSDGDEIEVDYATGEVGNLTTGATASYPPMAEAVREMVEQGGLKGSLTHWLHTHPDLGRPLSA